MRRAVSPASGRPAAASQSSAAGLRATACTGTVTSSAKVPPCTTSLRAYATTSSPTDTSGVSYPTASTTPATSQPGTTGNTVSISASSPPAITFQSTGFTPALRTRTSTCDGPTFGSGSSPVASTSGPPNRV